MDRGRTLDTLARDLASGEVSRRSALKRLAAVGLGLGAAAAPAGVAEALGGGCPSNRVKCGGKCCPKNARCKKGRCRCKRGFKKCGRKCVDLQTSARHCGECGNRCPEGETCVSAQCVECQDHSQCTDPSAPICENGQCVSPPPTCSDSIKNGSESDIDCGGPICPPCANGMSCVQDADCLSGACVAGICA